MGGTRSNAGVGAGVSPAPPGGGTVSPREYLDLERAGSIASRDRMVEIGNRLQSAGFDASDRPIRDRGTELIVRARNSNVTRRSVSAQQVSNALGIELSREQSRIGNTVYGEQFYGRLGRTLLNFEENTVTGNVHVTGVEER